MVNLLSNGLSLFLCFFFFKQKTAYEMRISDWSDVCSSDLIVPIEVVVRNVAAGSLSKKLGIEEGTQLPRTLIAYCYKDDALGDPLVSEEHIACFGWDRQDEMHDIADMAIRINAFMCGLFAVIVIRLIDFKLEFGSLWDGDYSSVILADELSPVGCR